MPIKKSGPYGDQNLIGARLTSARIVAGFGHKKDAADYLGKSVFQMHRAEHNALRATHDETLAEFANGYGISVDYLRDGAVSSIADGIAQRITLALLTLTGETDADGGIASRLHQARKAAGYRSAAAAANAMGQKVATYLAHESAARPIPIEKAALYALHLKIRPEFLLLGYGSMLPEHADPILLWRPRVSDENASIPKLQWMHGRQLVQGLSFRVVRRVGERFELPDIESISIPTSLLPASLQSIKGPVYGIDSGGHILLVDPKKSVGTVLRLRSGQIEIVESTFQVSTVDILSADAWAGPSILGRLLGRITIASDVHEDINAH